MSTSLEGKVSQQKIEQLRPVILSYINSAKKKTDLQITELILKEDVEGIFPNTLTTKLLVSYVRKMQNNNMYSDDKTKDVPKKKEAWKESNDVAQWNFEGPEKITTLEEALFHCQADLDIWEVDKFETSNWTTPIKQIVGKNTEVIQVQNSRVKIVFKRKGNEFNPDQFVQIMKDELKNFTPKFPEVKRTKTKNGHLLVIDVADLHIGKLADSYETGDDYNHKIAVKRAKDGIQGILDKSNGWNIDKILFVGGNDILHTDNTRNTTTNGTPQDVSQMWYKSYIDAKNLYVDVLQKLIVVADVHFVFNPSNHDYMSGFMLCNVIEEHFRTCANITFDCSMAHRKYYTYGTNLIGTSHGDGAKEKDLGSLMSIESKEDWADSKHRYFYIHHIHHKTAKDYINVTVEALRSPSGTDSWHNKKGYTGAPKAVEGFVHCKKHGQVSRLTHVFS